MTATPIPPAAGRQAAVDAALLILGRMGLCPDDLTAAAGQRPSVPTFAEYVPVVSAAVTAGTLKAYGSYWNRVTEQWVPGAWTTRRHRRSGNSCRTSGPTWSGGATPAADAARPRT